MAKIAPRLTKKPISENPKHWQNEVDGIKAYLEKLKSVSFDMPPNWHEKHTAYYNLRLKDLLTHPPKKKLPSGKITRTRAAFKARRKSSGDKHGK